MTKILSGWFSELCDMWPGIALSLKYKKHLVNKQSKFQKIDLYETENFGKMLVLDDIIQLTEQDEFAYQEMMTHVPLFSHPNPENVLVIGGGDGGILREVAKHKCVKNIDICEIDEEVINVAREFIPSTAIGFEDERVTINIADGSEFIKERQKFYDVIIVDSSDPIGPGEALFTKEFYSTMKTALKCDGIIANQAESFFLHTDVVKSIMTIFRQLFPIFGYAAIFIPTYPGGNIGTGLGSLKYDVRKPCRTPDEETAKQLKYYTTEVHQAAFVLPKFGEVIYE
ncbi:spermidine synthase [Lentisphaerota bacterium WC36G]|nr:spermidine synthase [Lentisphaerae bacterium WC36]